MQGEGRSGRAERRREASLRRMLVGRQDIAPWHVVRLQAASQVPGSRDVVTGLALPLSYDRAKLKRIALACKPRLDPVDRRRTRMPFPSTWAGASLSKRALHDGSPGLR